MDRCGELIIKIEESLDEGWIPKDVAPKGLVMVNHDLGMALSIDAGHLTMSNDRFVDKSMFTDQICKAYDLLIKVFGISKVNAPSLQLDWQRGFESAEEAEEHLAKMNLCETHLGLSNALPGKQSEFSFVVCSEEETTWKEFNVLRRYRMEGKTLRQMRQAPFDERLLQRARLLPSRQNEALQALLKVRDSRSEISPFAVQLSVEVAIETEMESKVFDYYSFISESFRWHEAFLRDISRLS